MTFHLEGYFSILAIHDTVSLCNVSNVKSLQLVPFSCVASYESKTSRANQVCARHFNSRLSGE